MEMLYGIIVLTERVTNYLVESIQRRAAWIITAASLDPQQSFVYEVIGM